MRILDSTDERMRLLFIRWGFSITICDLDRQKNVVEIIHMIGLFPIKRERMPFTEVTGAEVRKSRRVLTYYKQVLRLRHGGRLTFAGTGRDEALAATRLIRGFIGETL